MARYGRCMSRQEAKELRRIQRLYSRTGGLVPVFDCSRSAEAILRTMSNDRLREYFMTIGVRSPQTIVFFEVDGLIDVGPIPQKNGLREYKIPAGTSINVCNSIRL